MAQVIRRNDAAFDQRVQALFSRSAFDPETESAVAAILAAVRQRGDAALSEYARTFDHVTLEPAEFRLPTADIEAAAAQVDRPTKQAIRAAVRNLTTFARQSLPREWSFSPRPGVSVGERYTPLSRVGCYVPGGTAPLISTVVHTAALARAAGVPQIVLTTPPGPDKRLNPALLFAAREAGVTEIYRLGGVYAIGALAYGTASVPRVEKIVGPGNAYVTAAKRQVYGYVALDLVAGPSEIMILADETAEARFVAADMLSQAEHGSGREQAVLVTTAPGLIDAVLDELAVQSATLGRSACVKQVLEKGVFLIEARDLAEATALANRYAPEHLEIMTRRAAAVGRRITAAGAIFLGPWTPEPVGDFVAGPSHVLPTGGAARYFSGLTVGQFLRRLSVVRYDRPALLSEIPHIESFAAAEGLDAHGRSARIRAQRAPRQSNVLPET
jgi:histidinol dehydrogenase